MPLTVRSFNKQAVAVASLCGLQTMSTLSPGFTESRDQPMFRFFNISGVGPHSVPQCVTLPSASFTSKYNCGWGYEKENSVTVPDIVIVLST